jgi:uncharacterized membrane protein
MAKKRRLDPNRFKKQDDNGLFSFDPIRRNLFKWGIIAGAAGGFFMLWQDWIWQIVGVFTVVLISNHHINKAAKRIPRWHATIVSFLAVMVTLFVVIALGNLMMTYLTTGGQ